MIFEEDEVCPIEMDLYCSMKFVRFYNENVTNLKRYYLDYILRIQIINNLWYMIQIAIYRELIPVSQGIVYASDGFWLATW